MYESVKAAFSLDSTSPVGLSFFIERDNGSVESNENEEREDKTAPLFEQNRIFSGNDSNFQALLKAHSEDTDWSLEGIVKLYSAISPSGTETNIDSILRSKATYFFAPALNGSDEMVFQTVAPFLIRRRTEQLLAWLEQELESESQHPLIVIGCFHLLFLQIHPFPAANHRLSLTLLWKLLVENGYDFVAFEPLARQFSERSAQYFSALRQAEKTAGNTWSSINIWLEFFVESLLACATSLIQQSERRAQHAGLTPVQKQIVDVVKNYGSVSREAIVSETGINLSTVKYNLSVLSERGHLTREGGGRSTSYRAI